MPNQHWVSRSFACPHRRRQVDDSLNALRSDAHLFVTQPTAVNEGEKAETSAEGAGEYITWQWVWRHLRGKYMNGEGLIPSSGFHKLLICWDFPPQQSLVYREECEKRHNIQQFSRTVNSKTHGFLPPPTMACRRYPYCQLKKRKLKLQFIQEHQNWTREETLKVWWVPVSW